jgi:glycosyltransferase involved in cell wall biosynthesis
LKILYYIPDLHQGMGGLRQYAIALLKLLASDREHQYLVYHDHNDPEVLEVISNQSHLQLIRSRTSNAFYSKGIVSKFRVVYNRIRNRQGEDTRLNIICREHKIDVIHCPYQYLPVSAKVPALCTMHDVQELLFPEYFTAEDRAYRAVHYMKYIKNASGVIVSYEHIRQDILKYFDSSIDKVHVCFLNMSNLWIDKFSGTEHVPLTTLELPEQFFLYPANTWVHKNHLKILEALVTLRTKGIRLNFIFTGHKTRYFDEVLAPFIVKNDLSNQVKFLGIVEEPVLYSLYRHCLGVVVPTLYEAGSFPLMEAILLSVPVICSRVTSLPETIDNPEFLFDPNDPADIADKMLLLLEDRSFRARNLANSTKQAKRLKDYHALENFKAVYRKVTSATHD